MNKINGDSYKSLNIWRGEVSAKLDQIHETLIDMKKQKFYLIGEQKKINTALDGRLVCLETESSNRKAVSKLIVTLWAAIGGGVVLLGDKLWNLLVTKL